VLFEDLPAQLLALAAKAHQIPHGPAPPQPVPVAGLVLDPHDPVPAVRRDQIGEDRGAKGAVGQPGDGHPLGQQRGGLGQQPGDALPEAIAFQGLVGRPQGPHQGQGAARVRHVQAG